VPVSVLYSAAAE